MDLFVFILGSDTDFRNCSITSLFLEYRLRKIISISLSMPCLTGLVKMIRVNETLKREVLN